MRQARLSRSVGRRSCACSRRPSAWRARAWRGCRSFACACERRRRARPRHLPSSRRHARARGREPRQRLEPGARFRQWRGHAGVGASCRLVRQRAQGIAVRALPRHAGRDRSVGRRAVGQGRGRTRTARDVRSDACATRASRIGARAVGAGGNAHTRGERRLMPGHSRWRVAGTATLFIAPSLIPLLAFTVGPMLASLGISFTNWSLLAPAHWVGIDNYRALWSDGEFRASLGHTLLFIAGYLPLVLLGGLGVALALNPRIRGLALFRTVYFLPVVTSWVVVALIWKWLLNPQTGVVDYLLGLVGITGPGWWVDPHWAMPSIILASAWKDLGFVMIILLAGLQAIPDDYYQASSLDGAGAIARFRHITLPLLSPALFLVVVISLINNFQVFDQ